MFGSVVLDVVIGLIFIYLLYSLFATIIGEIISDILALRARHLEQSIGKMLTDQFEKEGESKNPVVRYGYYIYRYFFLRKPEGLQRKIYENPAVSRLGSNVVYRKPAYISTQTFASALIKALKEQGKGDSELEKIKDALKGAANKKLDKKGLELIEEKINELKPTSYEEFQDIVDGVMQQFETKDPKTYALLRELLAEANEDLDEFRERIEDWYDELMTQASGWYKSKIQVILIGIGFTLAMIFNINTFEIAKKLSVDEDARAEMVDLAIAFASDHDSIPDHSTKELRDTVMKSVKQNIGTTEHIIPMGWVNSPKLKSRMGFGQSFKVTFQKIGYIFGQTFGSFYNFFGFLLTALAISLGAPFWFDLLNKVIRLRSAFEYKNEEDE